MTNPLMDDTEFEEIKKLVREARFICKNCGRSARYEENLCNPIPLGA
jgi:transposase-like protein